ncbi:MAG TPA: hypothetical protein VH230_06220 [Stellaceae bacterium]|jgi:hypothetical protein|nr:hypothetical protein [Stellaceae bacterium]
MTSMATQDNMIASASATVEDLGPWFGALRFRYFGRRPLIEDNSVTSKPTTLVDLRVGYKFSDQGEVLARHSQPVRQHRSPPE